MESMTTTSACTAADRVDDGLQPGFAQDVHRPRVFHQAVGPQPDLIGRLLAAGVQHRAPCGLQPRCRLKQQGGLADTGFAADQRHRAGDDPAAEDEVELGEPGAPAGERFGSDIVAGGQAVRR